jgi:hypothetical protein
MKIIFFSGEEKVINFDHNLHRSCYYNLTIAEMIRYVIFSFLYDFFVIHNFKH